MNRDRMNPRETSTGEIKLRDFCRTVLENMWEKASGLTARTGPDNEAHIEIAELENELLSYLHPKDVESRGVLVAYLRRYQDIATALRGGVMNHSTLADYRDAKFDIERSVFELILTKAT
jgi:hypothetical protein